jgi:acid stress-induced BolA-like protein IbaG/YrbA
MQTETIKQLIETALENAQVTVTGDGHHFQAQIIYEGFLNKSRIERQQMIYRILNSHITSGELHAISLRTLTEEEFNKM